MLEIKQTIKNKFIDESQIQLCILYGSAANGRLTGISDIDIAVAGCEFAASRYVRLACDVGVTGVVATPVCTVL